MSPRRLGRGGHRWHHALTLRKIHRSTFVPGDRDVKIPISTATHGNYEKRHSVWVDIPAVDIPKLLATSRMVDFVENAVGARTVESSGLFSVLTTLTPGNEMVTLDVSFLPWQGHRLW